MEDNRGVREIAAYFLPVHAAGIIHYAPLFTHLSLQLFFMYSISEGPDRCRIVLVFPPFADGISPQWVPVGGISVKSSSPGAGQPFLRGLRTLI